VLFDAFVASEAYERVNEMPDSDIGMPVEQAFAAFLFEQGVGNVVTRRERDWALLKSLAQHPRPAFQVPGQIRRGARGVYVVDSEGDDHLLMAFVDGKLLRGAVTGLVAAALQAPERREEMPAAIVKRLVDMGLLTP